MTNEQLKRARDEHVPRGLFNVTDLFAAKAMNAIIADVEGREYIDFASGIGLMAVGHCHPQVAAAVRDQAGLFSHTCFHVVMYEAYIELAKRMNAAAPGPSPKKTIFANSGAEAVENAVKIDPRSTACPTATATDAHSLLSIRPAAWPAQTCSKMPSRTTWKPTSPPKEYFPKVKATCKKHGILFIADEIQSGFGRTGAMFAIEHSGVEPNLMTTAKALAAGYPLSAVTGRAEIMDAPHSGGLGGTYGGNPTACRAALAVLDIIADENLLDRAVVLGDRIRSAFGRLADDLGVVGDVRGLGAMVCMELVTDRSTKEPAAALTKALAKEAGLA